MKLKLDDFLFIDITDSRPPPKQNKTTQRKFQTAQIPIKCSVIHSSLTLFFRDDGIKNIFQATSMCYE